MNDNLYPLPHLEELLHFKLWQNYLNFLGFDEINEDGDVGQGGQQTPVQLRKQSNVTFSSKVDEITRSNTNNQHSNNNVGLSINFKQ